MNRSAMLAIAAMTALAVEGGVREETDEERRVREWHQQRLGSPMVPVEPRDPVRRYKATGTKSVTWRDKRLSERKRERQARRKQRRKR